jgi:RNA polymerase sigma-70 factor (ECF subfamily)
VFRLTGSKHEAEDLTQDICAATARKLSTGNQRVTTWLYRKSSTPPDRRRKQVTYGRVTTVGRLNLNRQAVIEENQTRADWLTSHGVPPVDLRTHWPWC